MTVPHTYHTLERKRLNDLLKAISHKKLALVIAGAGYGKSTLVAQAITDMAVDTVWYNLDASDQDLAVFMACILSGIQKHRSDFGKALWTKLSSPLASKNSREKLLLAFLMEIEQHIANPMMIILDDYYLVQESPEIAGAMEFLLARLPSNVHFILISRMAPPLRISRYRAMLDIIELSEKDLSFRLDEIEALYRELLEINISPANIQTLQRKTDGWAAALLLFFNAFKGISTQASHEELFDIGKSRKLIFKYLEENVFENLSDEIQRFMIRSSILACLDPGMCNEIFRMQNAQTILDDLCENHLLTFPIGSAGECYQYHHLLQEFLQNRLIKQYGRKEIDRHHLDIGKTMEHMGDLAGALHHFIAGEHFGEVSRMLAGLVLLDFKNIPIPFFKSAFDKIPYELIHQNARLLHIRAKLMSVSGNLRLAISDFKTALQQFRADHDATGTAGCLKDLAFHYYLGGDLVRAIKELKALWGHPHEDPFFSMEVAGYLILFSAIMGDVDASDRYYHNAVEAFSATDNVETAFIQNWLDLCHSFRFHVAGNFRKADTLNTRALDAFSHMKLDIFLPIANFQTALTAFYLADPSKGYACVQNGLRIAKKSGIFDFQYAWLLFGRALNGFGLGNSDQALQDAEEALDFFSLYNFAWGQASVYELKAILYRKQGKLSEALDAARTGLQIIAGLEIRVTQGALALEMAEILVAKRQYDPARQTLNGNCQDIRVSQFHLFRYHLLQARIDAEKKQSDQALSHVETALTIAKANAYDKWLELQRPWLTLLLVQCYHHNRRADYIEQLFTGAGRDADATLSLLKNKMPAHLKRATERLLSVLPHKVPAPLKIRCLGTFSVSIGDSEIPKQQWRSAKATLFFKYMVVRKEQGLIPKETLLELAWPDEDAEITNSRLHVALNALRKLLEPDLKRGVPSAYILRQNNGYRLEIGREGRIDILDFLQAVDEAAAIHETDPGLALNRYLKAASIYRGALFEEDPYEEWAMEDREILKTKYLQVLSKIIRLYAMTEAWHQCIEHAENYLVHDKYAEPVYRDLMQFYANSGNSSRVIQTFRKCRTRIVEELDCPLNHKTLNLYEKIIKN